MKTVEELAREAGMNVSMWNYGAGSIVFTMGTEGVARGAIERFRDLVLEEAEEACRNIAQNRYSRAMEFEDEDDEDAIFLHGESCGAERCEEAIRAMKGQK